MRHEVQTSSPADHCRHGLQMKRPPTHLADHRISILSWVSWAKEKKSTNRKEGTRRKDVLLAFARSIKIPLSKLGTKNFTSCSKKCFYPFSPFISTKCYTLQPKLLFQTTHFFILFIYFFNLYWRESPVVILGVISLQGVIQLCPQ